MKAVGYTRVSTGEQADSGTSLDEQRQRIQAWAEREGYEVEVFCDAISGRRDDRPALAAALEAGADAFVVAKLDRLGRGARYLLELFERFEADGIRFVALSDGIDTATMGGKTIMRFLAVIAETESDNIAERNRMAATALHRQGRYNGPAPLGYRFESGQLVVVEHEAAVVRRIFAEFLAGRSLSEIARGLNAGGVPTKRAGRWRQGTVGALLRNPVYVGRVRLGEHEGKGLHEAILDVEVFERAQLLAAAMSTRKGGGRGRPPVGNHLFRGGMLRCGRCGESMVPRTPYNRDHAQYYLCAGVQNLGCETQQVRRELIDSAVYSYFEQVGLDVEATSQAMAEGRDRKLAELGALLAEADAEAQRAAERLARVRRDYADGKLDAADWRDFREELMGEQQAAASEAERLRASLAEARVAGEDAEGQALKRLAELRRAIVGEIREAEGVEAVRAAFARMFERFVLHRAEEAPAGVYSAELALIPGFVIEPVIRAEAVDHHGEYTPVLRREALEQAENNERQGVGYRLVDGPETDARGARR